METDPQGADSLQGSGLREDVSHKPEATDETAGRSPDWQVGPQETGVLGNHMMLST